MAESIKQTINFELVSPEAKLISAPVKMAVVPGEEGELGVGAGHASFVVNLKPGVVQLFMNDNEPPRKIFITGGFADITGENCTVLAEEAMNVEVIDQDKAAHDVKALKDELDVAQEEAEKIRLVRKLVLAKAKLQAVTGKLVL